MLGGIFSIANDIQMKVLILQYHSRASLKIYPCFQANPSKLSQHIQKLCQQLDDLKECTKTKDSI